MVQKLVEIKGGGGSIKVGATGTVGALMTRELNSIKTTLSSSIDIREKAGTIPVAVPCSSSALKILQTKKPSDEAGSSNTSSSSSILNAPTKVAKGHEVPNCPFEELKIQRIPARRRQVRRKLNTVKIVDIKCGVPDRAWSNPIATKLKKLSFSRLSENII